MKKQADDRSKPEERAIPRAHRQGGRITFACVFIATIILVADVLLRLGVAVPVFYTGVVWIAGNSNDRRLTLFVAGGCTVYTLFGLFLSPPGNAIITTILINRLICILVIWVATALILQKLAEEKELLRYSELLEEKVEIRTQQLQSAHRKALQAERLAAIGQMVAGLAHESKNALQRIQSSINRLYRRIQGDEDLCGIVANIERASDDVGRLYEEVKSYAAPIALDKAKHSVRSISKKVWQDLAPLRKGREISFQEEIQCEDLSIQVDSFRVAQVFRNVLENAIAACDEAGEIAIRYSEGEIEGARAIRVAISDNGPGFSDLSAENIFNPFFTTKTKGTGLGMAIAKRIIDAHDGEIFVNRDHSSGAEIVVVLPRD